MQLRIKFHSLCAYLNLDIALYIVISYLGKSTCVFFAGEK